ncbi:MAG: hypothetical protein U0V49_08105 [Saprospiraceae bacterium]
MKKTNFQFFATLLLALLLSTAWSQDSDLQYFRKWNRNGINVFEPSKDAEQPAFDGLKLKLGASFSQEFQSLTHSNTPNYVPEFGNPQYNATRLFATTSSDSTSATLAGFNTAMANLTIDAQLADGIRMCVESYMSSRHHNEFWVKGGYIQVDKLPMFGNPEWFSKYLRLKVGHYMPNYGDMHFRRTDGGNTMYNPFVENYILDAFTTEIGGDISFFPIKGLMILGGMTNGVLHGNLKIDDKKAKPAPNTGDSTKTAPAFIGKIAYDNNFGGLRLRVSASFYHNSGSDNQTLYYGDRAGSHYFMIMEPNRSLQFPEGIPTVIAQSNPINNKDSGRFDPLFHSKVSAFMLNLLGKYKGLECFLTYENSKGRFWQEGPDERKVSQVAGELIYRFAKNENLFIGLRYNKVNCRPYIHPFDPTPRQDASIDRLTISAGWYPLKYIVVKAEYVNQSYKDFLDYRRDGKFNGFVLQTAVSF